MRDDLGRPLPSTSARRVVSLVPSLTESVAATGRLVGATDYCTHPSDLDVVRVGGTKWPDVAAVLALRPDLVLANAEENRPEDVAALREAGVAVWVTYPRTVPAALESLRRMFTVLAERVPDWLPAAESAWAAPERVMPPVVAVIPVWRRPWVVVGSDTFAGDVLLRLGVHNAYARDSDRYPRPTLEQIRARRPDLVVLPDEPYAFTRAEGAESFPGLRCAYLSGRHLTWYGPSLVEAATLLPSQLRGLA